MNDLVYYLSFFAEAEGFLFPDELPKGYYSPGLFLVSPTMDGKYAFSYTFDAMDNGRRVSLDLVRADETNPQSTLFVVRTTNYGSFWFDLRDIDPRFCYIGNRTELDKKTNLRVAISTDTDKLERTCKRFNFYFIGSTLRKG